MMLKEQTGITLVLNKDEDEDDDEADDVEGANWGHIGATPLAGPLLCSCTSYDDMEAFIGEYYPG